MSVKDEEFKTSIKEKIRTTENMNDVIDYINKTYRLGLLLAKEITDQLKSALKGLEIKHLESFLYLQSTVLTQPHSV